MKMKKKNNKKTHFEFGTANKIKIYYTWAIEHLFQEINYWL